MLCGFYGIKSDAGLRVPSRKPAVPAGGLAVVYPLTSQGKPYPFALPVTIGQVEGAILVDQLKSMDWAGRNAQFHSKAALKTLATVRQYVGVLLSIPAVQRN
jgi:mRNA-degrading endonuclease toxin of MazEF toxin-antitoxin module